MQNATEFMINIFCKTRCHIVILGAKPTFVVKSSFNNTAAKLYQHS